MTQTMYVHMNKWKNNQKKGKTKQKKATRKANSGTCFIGVHNCLIYFSATTKDLVVNTVDFLFYDILRTNRWLYKVKVDYCEQPKIE
jgi:hypothetical protein